jgi:hypothetical protein
MTNNPLIQKYEELYGKKEEPKEEPKKVEYEIPTEIKNLSITSGTTTNNRYTITATNPLTYNKTYSSFIGDNEFLRVADKIQKGEAKVVSTSMNLEHFTKSITFEVQVYT